MTDGECAGGYILQHLELHQFFICLTIISTIENYHKTLCLNFTWAYITIFRVFELYWFFALLITEQSDLQFYMSI
jgi:hypothetical protein